jgi:hypothetical protein
MNSHLQSHVFWGTNSPLTSFAGAALFVIASDRISAAIICLLALLWINLFTMLATGTGRKFFPAQGVNAVLIFVSSFAAFLFFFIVWLFSPVTAMESTLFILIGPVLLLSSGLHSRIREYDTVEMLSQGAAEAFVMGMLILALALIREPLGFGSFSIPGSGLIRFAKEGLLSLFQFSSGALILLGYGTALYRYHRNQYTNSEDE